MKPLPTDTMLLDGSGALYFVRKRPQAEPMTRQELRESSPHGAIEWQQKNYFGFFAFLAAMSTGLITAGLIAHGIRIVFDLVAK